MATHTGRQIWRSQT